MNVKVAAQTLSASVADALDFLHDEIAHPGFTESEATSEFIKRMDVAFNLMNSHHPLVKGMKEPMTEPYFKRYWAKACDNLTDYIFANGWNKTVTWGFAFSIQSVKAMVEELLYHSHQQFHYVLTYNFLRSHRTSLQ